jgi:hypothetical protein
MAPDGECMSPPHVHRQIASASLLLLLLLLPGVLGGLKTFLIASNNFTGTITEDLLYLPAIRHVDMSDNNFFGVLPAVALS